MIEIRQDDLSGEPARALIALHLAGMRSNSPPKSVFALNLSGLQAPEVTVWTAWINDTIVGVGALKMLDRVTAEVKSMRTHPNHVRKGVASALLSHIVEESRRRGLRRLSLETGRGPEFEPALALYRSRGFKDGGPFAEYSRSDFNQFLHLQF